MTFLRRSVITLAACLACGAAAAPAAAGVRMTHLSQFGTFGAGDGDFTQDMRGIDLDPRTREIVVLDASAKWFVQRFDPSGAFVSGFGPDDGSGPDELDNPQGLALSPVTGNVFVADTFNDRVSVFTPAGAPVTQFGSSGAGPGQLNRPWGVEVDPATGDVYVADILNDRVQRFTAGGTFVSQFAVNRPAYLAVEPYSGALYVASGTELRKFDSSGGLLTQIGSHGSGPGQFDSIGGVAVDPFTRDVYVSDPGLNRVSAFRSSGEFLYSFGEPGSAAGQFDFVHALAFDPETGDLVINDNQNSRVQRFGRTCTVTGTSGADNLTGTKGDDVICGGEGADSLFGSNGDDLLLGGDGDDTLLGGRGRDALVGGASSDIAGFYDSGISGVTASLVDGTASGGGAGDDTFGFLPQLPGSSVERLNGSAGADVLTGDARGNYIKGRQGDDTIAGGDGNDQLLGSDGADTLNGDDDADDVQPGAGADTADGGGSLSDVVRYGDATGPVSVDLGTGATGGAAAGDTLHGFETLVGSPFGDTLTAALAGVRSTVTGDGGDDTIDTRDGDGLDALLGKAGTDTCLGDTGDSRRSCP